MCIYYRKQLHEVNEIAEKQKSIIKELEYETSVMSSKDVKINELEVQLQSAKNKVDLEHQKFSALEEEYQNKLSKEMAHAKTLAEEIAHAKVL